MTGGSGFTVLNEVKENLDNSGENLNPNVIHLDRYVEGRMTPTNSIHGKTSLPWSHATHGKKSMEHKSKKSFGPQTKGSTNLVIGPSILPKPTNSLVFGNPTRLDGATLQSITHFTSTTNSTLNIPTQELTMGPAESPSPSLELGEEADTGVVAVDPVNLPPPNPLSTNYNNSTISKMEVSVIEDPPKETGSMSSELQCNTQSCKIEGGSSFSFTSI